MLMLERLPIESDIIINWISAIIRGSLQGAVLFGLVWAILRIFPKIHPAIRCWLWRIVYLKFLISFLGIEPVQIFFKFSIPNIMPSSVLQLFNTGAISQWLPAAQSPFIGIPATTAIESIYSPTLNLFLFYRWKFWFILWALGVGLFLIRLAFLWSRNRRQSGVLYPVQHPSLEKLYAEFCAQLKIYNPPRLFWSDSINSPSLQGLIRPRIILPASLLTQYQLEEIKLMLAHELAHFKRRDLWWNWLPTLTQVLFFFHPLVWLAGREWKEAPEICCDQMAVQFTGTRRVDYGIVLVKATCGPATCGPAPAESWFAGMGRLHQQTVEFYQPQSKKILKKRLIALDSKGHINQKWLIVSFVMLGLFGVAAVLPWKLTPVWSVDIIPPVAVEVTPILDVQVQYENHYLKFSGEVSPDYIFLNNCDVVIDNERIPIGAKWYNSGGEVSYNTFSGYFRVEEDFKINQDHQLKVVANTNVGTLRESYAINLNDREKRTL